MISREIFPVVIQWSRGYIYISKNNRDDGGINYVNEAYKGVRSWLETQQICKGGHCNLLATLTRGN